MITTRKTFVIWLVSSDGLLKRVEPIRSFKSEIEAIECVEDRIHTQSNQERFPWCVSSNNYLVIPEYVTEHSPDKLNNAGKSKAKRKK